MAATITITSDDVTDIGTKDGGSEISRSEQRTASAAASPGASVASMNSAGLTVGRVPLLSAACDALIVVLLGLTVLFTYIFGHPYERGFFCDDDSIRYTLKGDTVSSTLLLIMSVGIPTIVVSACELLAAAREGPAGRQRRVALGRLSLPAWGARLAWTLLVFVFGVGAQQVLVDAGKYSMGRLRPNFLSACAPTPPLSRLCRRNATGGVLYVYAEDYSCTGPEHIAVDSRLSFPSGHSSLSFYAAVFTALYAARRFRWGRLARLQLAFGQLVLVTLAWLTALSRVTDHKHHWSDVLAGSLLGALVAGLTVLFMLSRCDEPQDRAEDTVCVFEESPPDAASIAGGNGTHAHAPTAAFSDAVAGCKA